MNCEETELELSGGELSADARTHLDGCASCREAARLFGLAALPPLADVERLMLNGVAASTQQQWRAQQSRGGRVRQVASLALAAGVGALVASVAVLRFHQPTPVVRVETVHVVPPEVPVLEFIDANLSEDDVFFEVGWPSPTEGDL